MNQPLPYFVFVAGVAAAVACVAALFFVAYRRNARLCDMARFVVSPTEYSMRDLKIGSVLMSCFWFLVVNFSVTAIYHFVDILPSHPTAVSALRETICRCGLSF